MYKRQEQWPHGHEMLLALELAIYLAGKDGRTDDIAFLAPQRDRQKSRFVAFFEHEDAGVRSRGRLTRQFPVRDMKPAMP